MGVLVVRWDLWYAGWTPQPRYIKSLRVQCTLRHLELFKRWRSRRLMLARSIPLDSDFAFFFALCLCSVRFIPRWKRNALWELVNKTHQKFAVFGFGGWVTCPLRPSFAVCRIRREPLISAFKQRFWVWIVLYPVSDKFVLKDKLIIRTYRLYIQL